MNNFWSLNSLVVIATGYWPENRGSIPGRGRFLSSPQLPDLFWVHPLSCKNGRVGCFPAGKTAGM
jgi:hypothetical protein